MYRHILNILVCLQGTFLLGLKWASSCHMKYVWFCISCTENAPIFWNWNRKAGRNKLSRITNVPWQIHLPDTLRDKHCYGSWTSTREKMKRVISEALSFPWYSETGTVSTDVWVLLANAGDSPEKAMETSGLDLNFSPAEASVRSQVTRLLLEGQSRTEFNCCWWKGSMHCLQRFMAEIPELMFVKLGCQSVALYPSTI